MRNYLFSIYKIFIYVCILLLAISILCLKYLPFDNVKNIKDIFYVSEYLINYSAGITRRGLDGEIIYWMSYIFDIKPWHIIRVYSFTFFIFLFILCIYLVKSYRIPVVYFFSMSCFFLYLYYAPNLRKDHILMVFFIIHMLFITENKRTELTYREILINNSIFIICLLQHEIYFLLAFIPTFFAFIIKYNILNKLKNIFLLYFFPLIIFLLLGTLLVGNQFQEKIVIKSWEKFNLFISAFGLGVFGKPLYIWSINGTKLTPYCSTVGLFVLHFIFCISIIKSEITSKKARNYFIILAGIQYFIFLSLCIVAIDQARWIAFAGFSSIITIFLINKKIFHNSNIKDRSESNISIYKMLPYIIFPFITMPFFITPETTLLDYVNALPISIIMKFISLL